jgi:hypothetical protein
MSKPQAALAKVREDILAVLRNEVKPLNHKEIARKLGFEPLAEISAMLSAQLATLKYQGQVITSGRNHGTRYVIKHILKTDSPQLQLPQIEAAPPKATLCASDKIEVPKSHLKLIVKQVMADNPHMEGSLQIAVMGCLVKLI